MRAESGKRSLLENRALCVELPDDDLLQELAPHRQQNLEFCRGPALKSDELMAADRFGSRQERGRPRQGRCRFALVAIRKLQRFHAMETRSGERGASRNPDRKSTRLNS